jgi:hypothetical protein
MGSAVTSVGGSVIVWGGIVFMSRLFSCSFEHLNHSLRFLFLLLREAPRHSNVGGSGRIVPWCGAIIHAGSCRSSCITMLLCGKRDIAVIPRQARLDGLDRLLAASRVQKRRKI